MKKKGDVRMLLSLANASKGMRVGADPGLEALLVCGAVVALILHLAVRHGWIRTKHEGWLIAAVLAALLALGLLLGGVRIVSP